MERFQILDRARTTEIERVLPDTDIACVIPLALRDMGELVFDHRAFSQRVAPSGSVDLLAEPLLEVAEGDGPVNALDAALRKALNGHFPQLNEMHLVDYKVRVINSEAATAASVRVVIESRDAHDVWGTVGVHENVIEASWAALVDSIEYKLCKDGE
jgi:2-isopropylmalate synthase